MSCKQIKSITRLRLIFQIVSFQLLLSMCLASCSSISSQNKDDESLTSRVNRRWNLLIERDFAAAYKFESPAYRKIKDTQYFRKQYGDRVDWLSVQVQEVRQDLEDIATVRLVLTYEMLGIYSGKMERNEAYLKEKWIYIDGEWWHHSH